MGVDESGNGPCAVPGCPEPGERWGLCVDDGRRLAGACLGKTRLSQSKAQVLAKRSTWPVVAYACPVCGGGHLGRPVRDRELLHAEVAELVRRLRVGGMGWLVSDLARQWEAEDRMKWKTNRTNAERWVQR